MTPEDIERTGFFLLTELHAVSFFPKELHVNGKYIILWNKQTLCGQYRGERIWPLPKPSDFIVNYWRAHSVSVENTQLKISPPTKLTPWDLETVWESSQETRLQEYVK